MQKVIPKLSNVIKGATAEGVWGCSNTPVFLVEEMYQFNQLVGYVKYINATNGTVLYRGQPKDYKALKPSGKRGDGCISDELLVTLTENRRFLNYLGLDNDKLRGRKEYQKKAISAVLQHYGAKTNCMDFVDNHWCALWFGLYRFNPYTLSYSKREDVDGFLYIYLYLADTESSKIKGSSSVYGIYLGEHTYTIDLRRTVASYFLRPASQHGWIVCGKTDEESQNYAENVLCVVKIRVSDADKWLGCGALLTVENFFPCYDIDDGYSFLLTKQERSGVRKPCDEIILPMNTIRNYHFEKSFTPLQEKYCEVLPIRECYAGKEKIESLKSLYRHLIEEGWTRGTCFGKITGNQSSLCAGQSAATSLLVQEIFGGEIVRHEWKDYVHYFNRINGRNYDLTMQELPNPVDYTKLDKVGKPKKSIDRIARKTNLLKKNMDLSMPQK